jgi:peptidoglycan hydrolase-like protein with peptidoglycan-binding domain
MKKIIKLTESDLQKIVRRILKEDTEVEPDMVDVPMNKVEMVQRALVNAGYDIGPTGVDGKFGKNTRAAVIQYQRKNGIKQTGNVGPVTAGKLGVKPLTSGKLNSTQKTLNPQSSISKLQNQQQRTSSINFKPLDNFGNYLKMAQDDTYVKNPIVPSLTGEKTKKTQNLSGDYLMIIAFPEYEPKVDKGQKISWVETQAIALQTGEYPRKGTYGKIGHAGVAIISKTGDVKLFEFGRYNTKLGQGRVISNNLGKIAKIDSSGKLTNAEEVAKIVKSHTQGEGPRLQMVTAIVPVPNLDKAKAFAEGPAIREYQAVDLSQGGAANCGTFAIDTAKAGGVPIGDFCTPMPVKMIAKFKDYATEYFTV